MTGKIVVKSKTASSIKKGSPLISQMDLAQELRADEGEVVKVVDQQHRSEEHTSTPVTS